jgi:hypothetical protein
MHRSVNSKYRKAVASRLPLSAARTVVGGHPQFGRHSFVFGVVARPDNDGSHHGIDLSSPIADQVEIFDGQPFHDIL